MERKKAHIKSILTAPLKRGNRGLIPNIKECQIPLIVIQKMKRVNLYALHLYLMYTPMKSAIKVNKILEMQKVVLKKVPTKERHDFI